MAEPAGGGARPVPATQFAAAWERQAGAWVDFVRKRDHFAQLFNIPAFLDLLPPPGRLTLDVGCGEGRLPRDLIERGHTVKPFDASPTMVAAARNGDPPVDAQVADARALPIEDGAADLVVSFMALQVIDDLDGAIAEAARVLEPRGRFCIAVVHPMNSAEVAPSYFDEYSYAEEAQGFTFHDIHRPLSRYTQALTANGFVIEDLREPIPGPELLEVRPQAERWTRMACFLHIRARKG